MDDGDQDEVGNVYIAMWDRYGLESIVDATEINRQDVFDRLAGREGNGLGRLVLSMTLRAKFNTHRSYEIYSIKTSTSITEDDLRRMFEENPKAAADLMRTRGKRISSHRGVEQRQAIV